MLKNILKRLQSPVVWIAVIAQVAVIIAITHPEIVNNFKAMALAVIEILTLFGVLNNPDDKTKF